MICDPASVDGAASGPANLEISVQVRGGDRTIVLSGELELSTAPQLRAVIEGVVLDASGVVIDLDGIDFMDSSGLACVLECQATCQRRGLTFLLTPGKPQTRRLFEITGLLDKLPFTEKPKAPRRPYTVRSSQRLGGEASV